MSNELHLGGMNVKSLFKAVVSDIWMIFAVMAITYLGLGIAGNMNYTPTFTSSAVVAVYPFNQMSTLEVSSSALETVSAVNEVFNSEMFRTGLKNRLAEPAEYSLYSRPIDRTFILMLSVNSYSPENAYQILRTALDYYGEISSHLVGNSHLEILTEPDFPLTSSNSSRILKHRSLLTLFMGFAAGCFLVLMYAMKKTYKSASAIQSCYKNVRFFRVAASVSDKQRRRIKGKSEGEMNQGNTGKTLMKFVRIMQAKRDSFQSWYKNLRIIQGAASAFDNINKRIGRSGNATHQENLRKTALEVMQMLRAKKGSSIFVTSATQNEGKTEVAVSFAREMAGYGKSVIILETDSENTDVSMYPGFSDILPGYSLSVLLQDKTALKNAAVPNGNIRVIFADQYTKDDFIPHMAEDAEKTLKKLQKLADVILIDGCIWNGSEDERIWRAAADTSLAVCRQDKADFYAIDRMMADLRENDPGFLGCVLYGF